jgi:glycosyltransferase involved in cell wall biosynthesis
MPLNVLHISDSDAGGGSARSAFRVHSNLRHLGHVSRMLVGRPQTNDPDVRPLKRNVAWRAADRACGAVTEPLGLQYLFYPSSFGVASDPWFRGADVVQLFNLHGSYFSHTALPFLSHRHPTVWRLSDMWAFTGHVAYSYECERWRTGCGSCPYVHEYPPLPRDTSAFLWRWKKRVYGRSRLTVVAPSRWIGRLASESPLLSSFDVHHIPNGVELSTFTPTKKVAARRELGLDPDRHVVLFSAPDLDDRRKGGAVLDATLGRLDDLDFDLVVAGAPAKQLPRRARALGKLDEPRLSQAYAAADLFVLPALAENLPNAALESMAAGTPVVAFDVGGITDAVRHEETGLLAPVGDEDALAAGIRRLLEDEELRARLGRTARETAEREYDAALEARRFAELYEELLAPA